MSTTKRALRRKTARASWRTLARAALGAVTLASCVTTLAQHTVEAPPARTLELQLGRSRLTAGQPAGRTADLRGTWVFQDGQVAGFELLDETKFGARGGVAVGTYTRTFGPDWFAIGTLALGHGGPNWARQRLDLDIATKWGAARDIVTHVAVNGARYDQDRSDHGLRASVVAYLPGLTVIEGGMLLNVSSPGAVRSRMPYASLSWGRDGWQTLSLRVSSGSEAYQALGADRQLVDFHSSSLALTWRRWVDRRWGVVVAAEHYRNPSYQRRTASAGVLAQF